MYRTFLIGASIAVALAVLSLGYVFAQANEQDSPCITGEAVYEWDLGTGLVADCEALLAAKDALRGTASLNWSADRFIERWDGIDVGRQSRRVETIELHGQGLNGSIPSEIGSLDHLVKLKLYANALTGPLPPELGNLSGLEVLQVRSNQLSGQIPETLNNLSNLKNLALRDNDFTGCVPANLLNVRTNDVSRLGLPTCTGAVSTPTPPAAMPTATSVPPPGATPQPTPPAGRPTATPTMPPLTASPTPRPESLSEMVRRVRPAVVKITTFDTIFATGSGIIYRTDSRNRAYILTNHHVVDEADQLSVQVGDAEWFTPEVLHLDPRRDLAVLRICCGAFTSVGFADSDALFAGDDVIAIGYPMDYLMPRRRVIVPGEASVTKGIISAFRYDTFMDAQLVQNDASINPGNSGGPLFTPQGKVVGINTFGYSYSVLVESLQGLEFAVLETTIQDRLRLWAGEPADSFGPVSGELAHDSDVYIETWSPVFEATEDEFVLSATFANPYGAADHHWDYGFLFGETDEPNDQHLYFVVDSSARWYVKVRKPDGTLETLHSGTVPSLRLGSGQENDLEIRVDGPNGWLYVNGFKVLSDDDYPVEYLDLGDGHVTSHEGAVAVVTGFFQGSERAGAVTRYKDFQGETYDR